MSAPGRVARISAGEAAVAGEAEPLAMLIDVTTCIGCKACEVACVEWNDLHVEPETATRALDSYQTMPDMTPSFYNLIRFDEIAVDEQRRPLHAASEGTGVMMLMRKDMCMHCSDPGCLAACPSEGAIVQYDNGVVDFVHEACIGCGYCMTGCPFDIPKFDPATRRVHKCTMCSDRLGSGLGPACVKACPTACLQFGTKAEMKDLAERRAEQLRGTGFAQAGVYDPPGVGGTGVIYVLHHADQPELYGGLPSDPRVDDTIRLAKGPLKLAGNVAIAVGALSSALHYLAVGPTVVPEQEPAREREIVRYTLTERLTHWVTAGSFLYLLLTGMGLWSPAFGWLLTVLGGGQLARALHPVVGCVFAASVLLQALRWARDLLPEPGDATFLAKMGAYLAGRHGEVPDSGRFNAGQKLLFSSQVALALILLLSGLPLWWPEQAPRGLRLIAFALHPAAAVLAAGSLIVHLHMALLITRGALRAMLQGTVSASWARYHHGRWAERVLRP